MRLRGDLVKYQLKGAEYIEKKKNTLSIDQLDKAFKLYNDLERQILEYKGRLRQ